MQQLILSPSQRAEIVEWCLSRYPNEACGLIAGSSNLCVARVYPLDNVEADNPSTRYFMDPAGQLKAMRDAEGRGLAIIGAFHSHTRSEAHPSGTDIELAMYPDWVWVIVSLRSTQKPEVRAFCIRDGSVQEVEILVRK